ncbi:uncharacterized protein LTHEOB_9620 [Neofusicoccum parvum]|uniref:Uncharacterized protein LTHEOB_9620 n=1 Tax=Neofusicoccum parvum TaxID=310453 RepID=A0ACB5SJ81_9PEZI|nr:uncharacterized protein LTHEOB_9620 [Neofusicoccum parvum]GME65524.1 uncharacterized protein LTHEOB_9620 [Neofusicoccum parvum]
MASFSTAFISTTQQVRSSPYLPGGEARPAQPDGAPVSERAAAVRAAKLAEFDREMAEARERREREEREGGGRRKSFLQGIKEKIIGKGEEERGSADEVVR